MKILLLISLVISQNTLLTDIEGAYLDAPYENLVHPIQGFEPFDDSVPLASDTLGVIQKQTKVKSQGARGTCAIFSATALLEAMLVLKKGFHLSTDLSEEWLEYTVMQNKTSDGSSSYSNFSSFLRNGTVEESIWPYIGETWTFDFPKAKEKCEKVPVQFQKSCLLGHEDPRLLKALDEDLHNIDHELYNPKFASIRSRAKEFKDQNIKYSRTSYTVYDVADIKANLNSGIPMTLDVDFYYGAWNHRKAGELGIGRNMEHWYQGIIFYPVKGSMDVLKTKTDPAGHSVVIVGYDDSVEVTKKVVMEDGSEKEFTYKGVYYFKNSWGYDNFGVNFELDGVNIPGYGMIMQEYAHEFGQFFELPLK